MKEENIWKVYNFVVDWKAGRYGIIDLQTCADEYLKLDIEQ